MGNDELRRACRRYSLWWLGGFSFTGAVGASVVFAMTLGGGTILALLGIAILGVTGGLIVGLGIAQVIVVVADSLGWDENPRSSHVGRLVQCLDHLLDRTGP